MLSWKWNKKLCKGKKDLAVKICKTNGVLQCLDLGNTHWPTQKHAVSWRKQIKIQQNNATPLNFYSRSSDYPQRFQLMEWVALKS